MSKTPPRGIEDPYGPGLTWDQAAEPEIYAKNQAWARRMGYEAAADKDDLEFYEDDFADSEVDDRWGAYPARHGDDHGMV